MGLWDKGKKLFILMKSGTNLNVTVLSKEGNLLLVKDRHGVERAVDLGEIAEVRDKGDGADGLGD